MDSTTMASMMLRSLFEKICFTICVLCLAACVVSAPSSSPSINNDRSLIETQINTPTEKPISGNTPDLPVPTTTPINSTGSEQSSMTLTVTPETSRWFDLLPNGSFIAIGVESFSFLSTDGKIVPINLGNALVGYTLSGDGKYLSQLKSGAGENRIDLYNVYEDERIDLPVIDRCLVMPPVNVSSDGTKVIYSCQSEIVMQSITFIDQIKESRFDSTVFPDKRIILSPSWSPDDQQIAFFISDNPVNVNPNEARDRLMVANSSCLEELDNCQKSARLLGMLNLSGLNHFAWIGNNQIILSDDNTRAFVVYDVFSGAVIHRFPFPNSSAIEAFVVSPDKKEIAFGGIREDRKPAVYILSIADGKYRDLIVSRDSFTNFWILKK